MGESLPVDRGIGEDVFCGTINCFGTIDITASKVGEDSSLQKLILMVREAKSKQAPMQRIADKCASLLVPAALMIAVIAGLVTQDMISELNAMNTKTVLFTGDNQKAADYFAGKTGITEVYAELLPEEKVRSIEKLQAERRMVCMIGDGVNDAPALKTADVGIAMGSMGSDIAVEAADIALMSDDLSKIPYLKRLSNATVKTIRFSITLSMCINFLAVTLSVLGMLTPTTGALVHNAGSCLVVLIAALLYDRKFEL